MFRIFVTGRISVTGSVGWARVNVHIPKRGRGRGQRSDGEGSYQATQPTQSQVDDPTQYLNYQDQVHDAMNGGYDDQQFLDGGDIQQGDNVVPILDEDDNAAQTAPTNVT